MEKRSFNTKPEIRGNTDAPALEGYAFEFDVVSEDGVFGKEKFAPDCKISFGKKAFILRDHDQKMILGKRGKNCTIEADSRGLSFKVTKLPNTQYARDTAELIRSGMIEDSSVGFEDLKSDMEGGVRVFKKIRVHEISVLGHGYHDSSSVSARAKVYNPLPPECLC